MGQQRKWTTEELEFVKENYKTMKHKTMARHLNKSTAAIDIVCGRNGWTVTDGRHKHIHYKRWNAMIQRCHNKNYVGYDSYGANGITVCDEWRGFDGFYRFVKHIQSLDGYANGKHLDRINNCLGYFPGNVRWTTPKENSNNRRNTLHLTAFGETKALTHWVDDPRCEVSNQILASRIKLGWDAEAAITTKQLRKRWTKEQQQEIVNRINNGETIQEVADWCSVSYSSIKAIYYKYNKKNKCIA